MRIEWWILIAVYVVGIGILLFIPRTQIRLAIAAFLFLQVITFLIGLAVVQLGMIEYPVRCFASVNRTSFTYEFFAFPVISAAFNVWYPGGRRIPIQLGYYIGICSVLSFLEVLIDKYTDLIQYVHWEWYFSWVTIGLSLFLSRLFCNWFFAKARA